MIKLLSQAGPWARGLMVGTLVGLFSPWMAWGADLPYGANLIAHLAQEGVNGTPPRGTFHGISYDPSTGRSLAGGALLVNYRYGKAGDGRVYTEVELVNRAGQAANYTLNLSTSRVTLVDGDTYKLVGTVSAQGVNRPVMLALGFQFYKADGSYQSDMSTASSEFKSWAAEQQDLSVVFTGGSADPASGQVPASFFPRLAVYNIPAEGVVRLRYSGVALTASPKVTSVQVLPLTHALPDVAPGQVMPVTVELTGRPSSGPVASRLSLVAADGKTSAFDSARKLEFVSWAKLSDVWQVRLPSSLPLGTYALWYELPALKVKRKLGDVVVSASAGMWLGQSFHRYPGSSETSLGPIQGRYQFARSLASGQAYLMQWWLGPDEYDWSGIQAWAQYHAKPGEKKLVITFSGSPRWASSEPNQRAAMGVPGNAAPPAQTYRKAYYRMVRDTVSKFKSRMLASECWNEPNSPDFFTGSKTDLADLCKAVYQATKSVDATIPVICPQADDPTHLDVVYSARTSAGEPIHQFCDWVGAHIYNRLGTDANGQDYARQRLSDGLDIMMDMSRKYGINKPIAVTEFGLSSCELRASNAHPVVFGNMPSSEAAEALYQSMAVFRAYGVALVSLYSYDHGDNDPRCRPGGSFIRMTNLDRSGKQQIDPVVARRVSDAVADFGRARSE